MALSESPRGAAPDGYTFLQTLGTGTGEVHQLINTEPAKFDPAKRGTSERFLSVRFGTDTYLVRFQSDEERKKYVTNLQAALEEVGLTIRHKAHKKGV